MHVAVLDASKALDRVNSYIHS